MRNMGRPRFVPSEYGFFFHDSHINSSRLLTPLSQGGNPLKLSPADSRLPDDKDIPRRSPPKATAILAGDDLAAKRCLRAALAMGGPRAALGWVASDRSFSSVSCGVLSIFSTQP